MLGYFFYLTAGFILSPVKLLNNAAAVSTSFLSPQERAAAAADLVHSFWEIKVCVHFISFIKSLMWCKLYYFMQCNIRTRCQSAASAAVVSHWKRLCLA